MTEPLRVTPYSLASRFIGLREVDGKVANPAILAMLQLDSTWPADDDVPWCSAFLNYICWLLRLPRSKSLAARSWLDVGTAIYIDQAEPGFDFLVFEREGSPTSGHVALFAGPQFPKPSEAPQPSTVLALGGNQANSVSIAPFPVASLLGVRRLAL